ncbi:MAG: hypothetical protein RR228_01445 [Bacilli bacterium]
MQNECVTVTLEDNKDYIIVDEIISGKNTYVYLSSILDEESMCIRKSIIRDNNEVFISLDNEEEFNSALLLFKNKYENMNA